MPLIWPSLFTERGGGAGGVLHDAKANDGKDPHQWKVGGVCAWGPRRGGSEAAWPAPFLCFFSPWRMFLSPP